MYAWTFFIILPPKKLINFRLEFVFSLFPFYPFCFLIFFRYSLFLFHHHVLIVGMPHCYWVTEYIKASKSRCIETRAQENLMYFRFQIRILFKRILPKGKLWWLLFLEYKCLYSLREPSICLNSLREKKDYSRSKYRKMWDVLDI